MEADQERVVAEKKDLEEKRLKLYAFMQSERFSALPGEGQARLHLQDILMRAYAAVLGERIEAFSG